MNIGYERELLLLFGNIIEPVDEFNYNIINKDNDLIGSIIIDGENITMYFTDERINYYGKRHGNEDVRSYNFSVWSDKKVHYDVKLCLDKERKELIVVDDYLEQEGKLVVSDNMFSFGYKYYNRGITTNYRMMVSYGMKLNQETGLLEENKVYSYDILSKGNNAPTIHNSFLYDTSKNDIINTILSHEEGIKAFNNFREFLQGVIPSDSNIVRIFFASSCFREDIIALFVPEFLSRVKRNEEEYLKDNIKKRSKKRKDM